MFAGCLPAWRGAPRTLEHAEHDVRVRRRLRCCDVACGVWQEAPAATKRRKVQLEDDEVRVCARGRVSAARRGVIGANPLHLRFCAVCIWCVQLESRRRRRAKEAGITKRKDKGMMTRCGKARYAGGNCRRPRARRRRCHKHAGMPLAQLFACRANSSARAYLWSMRYVRFASRRWRMNELAGLPRLGPVGLWLKVAVWIDGRSCEKSEGTEACRV